MSKRRIELFESFKGTPVKWKLTKSTKNEKNKETIYHYSDGKRTVELQMHPTKPFAFIFKVVDGDVSNKERNKIIDKFVENGVNQHDFKGGFDEAISVLEI